MGRIYCVMGKSASGKDSIYHEVMKQEPELLPIVPYTTRPIRQGEIEGREYHFCDETRVEELEKGSGKFTRKALYTVIIRYVAPIVMLILFLQSTGILA